MKKIFFILIATFTVFLCSCSKNGNLDEEFVRNVKESLSVPDDAVVTCEIGDETYWDAAEKYYVNVSFFQDGEFVAGAKVDAKTGELLGNIYSYSPAEK